MSAILSGCGSLMKHCNTQPRKGAALKNHTEVNSYTEKWLASKMRIPSSSSSGPMMMLP